MELLNLKVQDNFKKESEQDKINKSIDNAKIYLEQFTWKDNQTSWDCLGNLTQKNFGSSVREDLFI